MKLKARSRLGTISPPTTAYEVAARPLPPSLHSTPSRLGFKTSAAWWTQRQAKLTSLIIGLSIYSYLAYLLTNVFPAEIRNWLIPNGFLPLIGLAALGHVYTWGFITLNLRLASLISLSLSWLLWLQLHHFVVDWLVVSLTIGLVASTELTIILIQKRNKK